MRAIVASFVALFLCVPAADAASRKVRAVTYNVWGLPGPLLQKPQRLKEMKSRIPLLGADILAFQETFDSATQFLAEYPEYPHRVRGRAGNGLKQGSGLLIVSRWPIVQNGFTLFTHCTGSNCMALKGALWARVEVPDVGPVDVFTTHLNAGGDILVRIAQAQQLAELIDAKAGPNPVIAMGDFNFTPQQGPYPELIFLSALRDTHYDFVSAHPELPEVRKNGFTADPDRNPFVPKRNVPKRIDYIFVRGFQTQRIDVLDSRLLFDGSDGSDILSDHFGVMTDLEFFY